MPCGSHARARISARRVCHTRPFLLYVIECRAGVRPIRCHLVDLSSNSSEHMHSSSVRETEFSRDNVADDQYTWCILHTAMQAAPETMPHVAQSPVEDSTGSSLRLRIQEQCKWKARSGLCINNAQQDRQRARYSTTKWIRRVSGRKHLDCEHRHTRNSAR